MNKAFNKSLKNRLVSAMLIGCTLGSIPSDNNDFDIAIPQQGWRLPDVPEMKSKHNNKKRKKRKARK